MKRFTLLLVGLFCFAQFNVQAQLADGTIAPAWTLTDLNNVTHDLYTQLDNNKHVIMDFSATWCPPCWNYHTSGILDQLYHDYGPTTGTDQLRVYHIEADGSTNTACMYGPAGCNGNTMGNWVAGTPYPMFNLEGADLSVKTDYQISYFPTLYAVNAYDNRVFESGQMSYGNYANLILNSFELQVAETISHATCTTYGSIYLAPTGGTGNLQYSWSDGSYNQNVTNAIPGDYYVTVTDALGYFIKRGPFTVNNDGGTGPSLTITLDEQENVSCYGGNDGKLSVTGSGGLTGNYTYQWSNGESSQTITDLGPGTYSVVVTDDIGCYNTDFYTITEPSQYFLNYTEVNPTCDEDNGAIIANGFGGTPPYQYYLNGQYSATGVYLNLPEGNYSLDCQDSNNCQISNSIVLVNVNDTEAEASSSEELTCNVTEITLSGDGSSTGPDYSYEWRNTAGDVVSTEIDALVSEAGMYTLDVSNTLSGCVASKSVEAMADLTPPSISSDSGLLTCTTTSVEICATSDPGTTITWKINGDDVQADCVTVDVAGDYEATATSANGCSSTSISLVELSDDIPEGEIAPVELLTCTETEQTVSGSIVGELSDHTITWSTNDGNVVEVLSPLEITVDAPGVYTMSVVNINTGCELLTNTIVEENINTPIAGFTFTYTDFILSLEDNSAGSPSQWTWSVDGVEVSTESSATYDLTGAEEYDVCLTIVNECDSHQTCERISVVTPLTGTAEITHVVCNGQSTGAIVITAEGGVEPYEYEVTGPNGFASALDNNDGLVAGTYEVVITDSDGDEFIMSLEIIESDPILLFEAKEKPLCFEGSTGSITIDAEGGNGDYTFEWSDGSTAATLSDIAAGMYECVVTDKEGCQETIEVDLEDAEPIVVDGLKTEIACHGETSGAIQLTVDGGAGDFTYLWDNGSTAPVIANLGEGDYECVVTDGNGCESVHNFSLVEPSQLILGNAEVTDDLGGAGGSITIEVNGGTSPYTFVWSNGATTQNITDLMEGVYSVQIIDARGCEINSDSYNVGFVSSSNELSSLELLQVYPNPASDQIQIALAFDTNVQFELGFYNLAGQRAIDLGQHEGQFWNKSINIDGLQNGLYLLYIKTDERMVVHKVSILK